MGTHFCVLNSIKFELSRNNNAIDKNDSLPYNNYRE